MEKILPSVFGFDFKKTDLNKTLDRKLNLLDRRKNRLQFMEKILPSVFGSDLKKNGSEQDPRQKIESVSQLIKRTLKNRTRILPFPRYRSTKK